MPSHSRLSKVNAGWQLQLDRVDWASLSFPDSYLSPQQRSHGASDNDRHSLESVLFRQHINAFTPGSILSLKLTFEGDTTSACDICRLTPAAEQSQPQPRNSALYGSVKR